MYLKQARKEVLCMIRQLGVPTFFMSLSSADLKWTPLLQTLGELIDHKYYTTEEINNLSWQEKNSISKI